MPHFIDISDPHYGDACAELERVLNEIIHSLVKAGMSEKEATSRAINTLGAASGTVAGAALNRFPEPEPEQEAS